VSAPQKCENCGYSSRHSRQQSGEKLLFCKQCRAWLCGGCRDLRCADTHITTEQPVHDENRAGIPPNDGVYSSIPDTVYHSDPMSLSSSGARELLSLTPEEFDYNRRQPPKPKPQYDFGHAAHRMVLGEGADLAVLDPAIHGRNKDGSVSQKPTATAMWKQAEAKARQQGKAVITRAQMDTAQRMAGRVFENRIAAKLLCRGDAEMSIYWHDDETGVRRRARPDFITDEPSLPRVICLDYKSALSADPKHFEKQVINFGYHCQQAWYEDSLYEIGIDDAGFLFIVQQKTPPFLVSVCAIDPQVVELGRRQNRRAIQLYAKCSDNNDWPGYGDGIHTVGMPAWAVNQIEAALDAS
jgi:hypothetical protein